MSDASQAQIQRACARRSCRKLFVVCEPCDTSRVYCSIECSDEGRAASLRSAGGRYQATPRGKALHAARQARYRARVASRGSTPLAPDATPTRPSAVEPGGSGIGASSLASLPVSAASQAPNPALQSMTSSPSVHAPRRVPSLQRCIVCGRPATWVCSDIGAKRLGGRSRSVIQGARSPPRAATSPS